MAKQNKGITAVQLGMLVGQRNYKELRELLYEMNSVDVAQFIEELPSKQQLAVFRTLHKAEAMEVFAELMPDTQRAIVESISDSEITDLMDELMVDDAVDMLEEMPATLVKRVLKNASPNTRDLVNQFLHYPEDSAGSVMTAEFTDLGRDMTVEEAILRIRQTGENRETIYTCYVIDATRHLEGVVTVKDLFLAHDTDVVQDLMEPDVIYVRTTAPREEAVALMTKYGFISLPVVDAEDRLVGIVTVDDAIDIMQEETTEDFEKMAGMAPSEKPYLKTNVFLMAKNRFLWLIVLMVSGMITGGILGRYQAAFAVLPLLVTFIPMLTDTGGNAGSQSSTLVIRGMVLGEIEMKDMPRVFWKEFRVSLLVGVPLALINYLRISFFYPESGDVGKVVSMAMVCTVVMANSVGGILPMVAKFFRIDPAIMAAPLISTLVDAASLVVYFSIAMLLLPI